MHKCVRCGRQATSIKEINDGCPCGSKAFVFNKEVVDLNSIAGEEQSVPKSAEEIKLEAEAGEIPVQQEAAAAKQAKDGEASLPMKGEGGAGSPINTDGGADSANGSVPTSYHARTTFTSDDVENIKVVSLGVFALELHSLSKNPVVLKDEEGIYYIKIPLEQTGVAAGKLSEGKAAKKKKR